MAKKLALIDIDGCLCEYPNPVFMEFVNRELNEKFLHPEIIKKQLPIETYKKIKNRYRDSGEKLKIPLKQYSLNALKLLKERSYELIILTSRPSTEKNIYFTHKWLHQNNVPHDIVIHANPKDSTLFTSGFEHMIVVDDENKNLINYDGKENILGFSFDKSKLVSQNIHQVDSWDKIISFLDNI